MGLKAYIGCPDLRCEYRVRFHAPDVTSPPESLMEAWTQLLWKEHPVHPRPLTLRRIL